MMKEPHNNSVDKKDIKDTFGAYLLDGASFHGYYDIPKILVTLDRIPEQLIPEFRDKSKWKSTLNEYIKQNDPGRVEKANAWKVAIGLQDVDGLKTSEYLLDTARDNIEGKIDFDSANARISRYYEEKEERNELAEEKEADIVSARIAQLLSNKTFTFSPASLQKIHEHLFKGIVSKAGKFRTYNITKKEWVLNNDRVPAK